MGPLPADEPGLLLVGLAETQHVPSAHTVPFAMAGAAALTGGTRAAGSLVSFIEPLIAHDVIPGFFRRLWHRRTFCAPPGALRQDPLCAIR
ncbi:hypothetical protein GCM10027028_22050 [Streptomyces sundarbansensis]